LGRLVEFELFILGIAFSGFVTKETWDPDFGAFGV